MAAPVSPSRLRAGGAVLTVAIVASSMSYIDSTALTVALPVIQRRLAATDSQAQWIVEAYLLFLCSLILIGGGLGDRYGRRRLFTLGTWTFALSSVGCALATTPGALLIARCLQGAGAALMIPGSLALITSAFDARERGRAIGIWAAASAITMAIGPALGGWFTQSVSWRGIFWINIPLAILVLVISYARVPESRAERVRGKPDAFGSMLAAVGLGLIVVAMIEMQQRYHPHAFPLLIAGLVLMVAFVFAERAASAPVAPLRLFALPAFSVASAYTFLLYAALGGALFFVPYELQHVMGYGPFASGLALLPTIALIALCSPFATALAARIGPRTSLISGAVISAIGFGLFSRLGIGAPYVGSVFPATIVLGIGLSVAIAPLVSVIMGAADANDIGAASGINNSISRVGNLMAIAALGIVIAWTGDRAVPVPSNPQGFPHAMLAAATMSLAAACAAILLPRHRA